MKHLAQAIVAVMKEVKGIDKATTVGVGSSSYKGVSDQDVKKIIGEAMERNGLCIVPTAVDPSVRVDRWEETYNGQAKQKQSVFTEVRTKYLLMHVSGESIELAGYGHGVDTQDKSAGKSTTYALKYALLYTFMVPTGKIDDADATHSDDVDVPKRDAFTLDLVGCETAADLNAFEKKHWMKNWTKEQAKQVWEYAQTINVSYDKAKKSFV